MILKSKIPIYIANYDLLLSIFKFRVGFGKVYSLMKGTNETLTASKRQPKFLLR
jgi:hypothetical protein